LRHLELVAPNEVRLLDERGPLHPVVLEHHPQADALCARLRGEDVARLLHEVHHVDVSFIELHDAGLHLVEGQQVVEDVDPGADGERDVAEGVSEVLGVGGG
jgi:hypothetical protein